jgi:hypothetical protein
VRRAVPIAAGATIVVVAAVLRLWGLGLGLPHLMARPDDEAVLRLTGWVGQGHADLGWAVYPSAWIYLCWAWGAVSLHAGQWLGLLPPSGGYVEVLAHHPARLLYLERTLSVAFGVATVLLVMRVARGVLGTAGALVAGTVLATNFLHARDTHSIKPDVALGFGVILTLAAAAALASRATRSRAVRAGAALGLATGIKYPGVLLAVPVWLAAVQGSVGRWWARIVPRAAVVAGVTAAAVFVASSPFLLVNEQTRRFLTGVVALVFPTIFPMPASARGVPGLGLTATGPSAFAYHLTFSLRWGAGIVATVLAPVAVIAGLLDRRPLVRLAAVFGVFYYGVVGTSPVRLARYMTPVMPVLALLLAALVVRAGDWIGGRWRVLLLVVATAAIVAEPLHATIAHDRIAARADTRNLATDWLEAHAPPGAVIAMAGTRFWGWGQPRIPSGMHVVQVTPTIEELAKSGAAFLVTHDHPLFSSTVDAAAVARAAPALRLVADFDPFRGPPSAAVFEAEDAYYIPIGGFAAVRRPGPHVRIYAVTIPPGAVHAS